MFKGLVLMVLPNKIRADKPTQVAVRIEALHGDGDLHNAAMVSTAFREKTRALQHQMICEAPQGRMGNELHGLALQTTIPPEA